MKGWRVMSCPRSMGILFCAGFLIFASGETSFAASPQKLREAIRQNATARLKKIRSQSNADSAAFFRRADQLCKGLDKLLPADANELQIRAFGAQLKRISREWRTHLQLCAELAMLRRQPSKSYKFALAARTLEKGPETLWAIVWVATALYSGEGVRKSKTQSIRYLEREIQSSKNPKDKQTLRRLRENVFR